MSVTGGPSEVLCVIQQQVQSGGRHVPHFPDCRLWFSPSTPIPKIIAKQDLAGEPCGTPGELKTPPIAWERYHS